MERICVLAAAILSASFLLCSCGKICDNLENETETFSEPIVSKISSEDISSSSSSVRSTPLSESDSALESPEQSKILIAYFT